MVGVLGPVVITDDTGNTVEVGSRSQRIVLAVLAAASGRVVPVERLVDALWGETAPSSAVQSARTYVSRLRRTLGDDLRIETGGYLLLADTDLARFEAAQEALDTLPAAEALARADEALGLWRGGPFGDVSDTLALAPQVARLEELHTSACERRVALLLAAGRPGAAIAAAEELLVGHPYREGAWSLLVEALVAAARPAEALRAHQRAVGLLRDAGLVPSDVLRRAERAALGEGSPPRGAVSTPATTPVPTPLSSIVGREHDLAVLEQLHRTARLVTLVGPGGVGKTRLAIELARRVAPSHEHGSCLVELGGVDDPAAVVGVVAASLGLTVDGASPTGAISSVGGLDLVVVLDNCEHVADSAAAATAAMLSGGDRLRVIATSRERLAIDGEHVWSVAPLASGDERSPAAELFVERARAVRPTLRLDDGDRAAIDRIVRRVDGLPLAIEMAAARAASMSPSELADRLDSRLDVLRSVRRDVDPRHATLAAVVEWSEGLLDPDDRDVLHDLSVFAGAVTARDVVAVTGRSDAASGLEHLAERSLLVVEPGPSATSFRMLSTVRTHAAERLEASGRAARLKERHAEHVVAELQDADRALRGADELAAHERMTALLDEAGVAHSWAGENDLDLDVALCAALHYFAQSRLVDEPMRWASELARRLEGNQLPAASGRVFASAAQRAIHGGDLGAALTLGRRGMAMAAAGPADRAAAAEVAADALFFSGRIDEAAVAYEEMAGLAAQAGDPHLRVAALASSILVATQRGRWDDIERLLRTAPEIGAVAPSDLAWLAFAEGESRLDRDPEHALTELHRAIELADRVGNRYVAGVARLSWTTLRSRVSDPHTAAASYAAVISHWRRRGAVTFQETTLRNLVELLERVDAQGEAAELLGTLDARANHPSFGSEAERIRTARERVTVTIGGEELRRRLELGASRSLDEAAEAALAWLAALER
jgi:predicted ATPase/DNA-binding SARP family transcriptional activator